MTDKSDPLLSQWGKPKNLRLTTAESSLFGGGYTWPNIFDEANEMLFASILIYALADLRTLARQGLLVMAEQEEDEDDNEPPAETYQQKKDVSATDLVQQILTLPFSTKEIVRLVSKNRDTLVEEFGESATDLYLSAFDLLETTTSTTTITTASTTTTYVTATDSFDHCCNHYPTEPGAPSPPPPPSSEVVVCDDENKTEELVYGIWICSARRRITVTFRGCKTMTDWSTSANQYLKTLPNPVMISDTGGSSTLPSSWPTKKEIVPDSIGLHYGFYSTF
jgi:hypothetical protein